MAIYELMLDKEQEKFRLSIKSENGEDYGDIFYGDLDSIVSQLNEREIFYNRERDVIATNNSSISGKGELKFVDFESLLEFRQKFENSSKCKRLEEKFHESEVNKMLKQNPSPYNSDDFSIDEFFNPDPRELTRQRVTSMYLDDFDRFNDLDLIYDELSFINSELDDEYYRDIDIPDESDIDAYSYNDDHLDVFDYEYTWDFLEAKSVGSTLPEFKGLEKDLFFDQNRELEFAAYEDKGLQNANLFQQQRLLFR